MQFSILIEPSVFNDNRIIGGDEFNALTELIAKANTDYTYVLVTAKESADSAQASENNAKDSETHAAASAGNAANSASIATEKSAEAADSADSSAGSANDAAQMAASAKASASLAQSHAAEAASLTHGGTGTREGENSDNAQYYYLQSKSISESLAGALRPMGTVAFEGLPPLSSEKEGNMYNISEEFITTAAFKEGEGHTIPAGANVYKTSDGYWDILAGTPVTGVKGESESSYRRGNVSITREDIGLGNVEDKSSETIRSELTKENVVDALGYTPSVADGTVTGVKGSAEAAYRTGDVNITPTDIGLGNIASDLNILSLSADFENILETKTITTGNATRNIRFLMSKDRKLGWLTCAIYGDPAPDIIPTISINGYKTYYELFHVNDKLTNSVLSGSISNGFSGLAQRLAQVPLFYKTSTGTFKWQLSEAIMFYDPTASVTRVAAEMIRNGFSNQQVLWTVSATFLSPDSVIASILDSPTL